MLVWGWVGLAESGAPTATLRCLLADGFDYPVGKPDAKGYYKYRGFWPNGHLGEDWNGVGGGDTDLGDPIYTMGRGVVVLSEDVRVGWGNCVIVRHAYRDAKGKIDMVDSLYAHLQERSVKVGDVLEKGQLVGTMGGNRGMYAVHLHFEIRKNLQIGMNRSAFARDYSNYYSPTAFIEANRKLPASFQKVDIPMRTFAAYGKSLASLSKDAGGPDTTIPTISALNEGKPLELGKPASKTETDEDDFWAKLKQKMMKQAPGSPPEPVKPKAPAAAGEKPLP